MNAHRLLHASLLPAVFAGLLGAMGCGDASTGVLLTVVSTTPAPSAIELTWLDQNHVLFQRHAPESGTLSAAEAARFTVFIEVKNPGTAGSRRVVVRGMRNGQPVSEGVTTIDRLSSGITRMQVTLLPGLLPDGDADQIPDQIDRCPTYKDPKDICTPINDGGVLDVRADGDAGAIDAPIDAPVDVGERRDQDLADDRPAPPDVPITPDVAPPPPDVIPADYPPQPVTARFRVGTFTKLDGMAGTRQVVTHGLGVPPKALLLWTSTRTDDQPGAAFLSIGVSDGPAGTSGSTAVASQDQTTSSLASRRIAAKALTVIFPNGATAAEAELVAWDGNTLTLSWDPNGAGAYRVHYLVIGGEVAAKVLSWLAPVANNAPLSIVGVGFRPSVVMHFHVGTGSGISPSLVGGGLIGTGVMTAAGRQWANAVFVQAGIIPSNTARVQRTDQALVLMGDDDTLTTRQASFVSMDADGFTTQFTGNTGAIGQIVSLALGGVAAAAGSFTKSTAAAPADQPVAGINFRPAVVLLASTDGLAQPARQTSALLGLGASDGIVQACSSVSDIHALPTTSATALDRESRVFIKATQQIEAEADLAALNVDGFRLRWTTNDPTAPVMTYLTLGPP
jgi:hypothetical protein